jgi:parvulin-like peptidyl-prolyl isomerase
MSPEEVLSRRWEIGHANHVRANVNGDIITQLDVRKRVSGDLPAIQRMSRTEAEFERHLQERVAYAVQSMTDDRILVQEFRSRGGSVPAVYVNAQMDDIVQVKYNGDRNAYLHVLRLQGISPLEARRQIEEELIIRNMRAEFHRAASEISPQRVADYYEAHKDKEFQRTEQMRFRQITLAQGAADSEDDVRARARLIVDELKKGAAFGDLARRHSRDDYRNEDGGAAHWRELGATSERIATALKALPDGGVTEPMDFTSPGGRTTLFLFQRVEYRPGGVAPLSEVREFLANKLSQLDQNAAIETQMEHLRRKYFVRYY